MPSNRLPTSVVSVGNAPPPVSGAAGGSSAALLGHINDPVAAHAASAISYAGGPTWADGSTNPASEVEAQLDKTISDLGGTAAATSGDNRVGVEASTVGTVVLASGTLRTRLTQLQSAANINYAGGGTWADASTNPATNVEAQLDKIISDLGAVGGSNKIGYNGGQAWADGTTNPATTVEAQLDKIISDLNKTTGLSFGTHKIGSGAITTASVSILAGTLHSHILALVNSNNHDWEYDGELWADGSQFVNGNDTTVQGAISQIVLDVADATVGFDGAKRVGAAAATGYSAGSVRTQLDAVVSGTQTITGAKTFTNVTSIVLTEKPTATTSVVDKVNAINVGKVWGYITLDGVGGITLADGMNVTSVAIVGTTILVTIAGDMANVNYAVLATMDDGGGSVATGTFAQSGSKATGSFVIRLYEGPGGTLVDPATDLAGVNFMVMGRQ